MDNMKSVKELTRIMKADSFKIASLSADVRNKILARVKEVLIANASKIFEANAMDMDKAASDGIAQSVMKRLKFDEHKLEDVTKGIDQLISLPDPIGKTIFKRQLDTGLILESIMSY